MTATAAEDYEEAILRLIEASEGAWSGPTTPAEDVKDAIDGTKGLDTKDLKSSTKSAVGKSSSLKIRGGGVYGMAIGLIATVLAGTMSEKLDSIFGDWFEHDDGTQEFDKTGEKAADTVEKIDNETNSSCDAMAGALLSAIQQLTALMNSFDHSEHPELAQQCVSQGKALIDECGKSITDTCEMRNEAISECLDKYLESGKKTLSSPLSDVPQEGAPVQKTAPMACPPVDCEPIDCEQAPAPEPVECEEPTVPANKTPPSPPPAPQSVPTPEPCSPAPETKQPEVKQPEVKLPEIKQPSPPPPPPAPVPSTPAPSVTEPCAVPEPCEEPEPCPEKEPDKAPTIPAAKEPLPVDCPPSGLEAIIGIGVLIAVVMAFVECAEGLELPPPPVPEPPTPVVPPAEAPAPSPPPVAEPAPEPPPEPAPVQEGPVDKQQMQAAASAPIPEPSVPEPPAPEPPAPPVEEPVNPKAETIDGPGNDDLAIRKAGAW